MSCEIAAIDKHRPELKDLTANRHSACGIPVNVSGDHHRSLGATITLLREHPHLAGAIGYNEFASRIEVVRDLPWGSKSGTRWDDAQTTQLSAWLQNYSTPVTASRTDISAAVDVVSQSHPFNPLREWLNSLEWDRERRLDSWLVEYLGVEDTEYACAIGRCWMISAVARAMSPGCQVDTCLVLEGKQGIGKSSALRILAGDQYYRATALNLNSLQNAVPQLQNVWIYELAELDSLTLVKHEASDIKRFLTDRSDDICEKYNKYTTSFPRKLVFAATTNKSTYIRDETGARRFWPVICKAIDLEALKRYREQLWAEAVAAYRAGEEWHLKADLEALACDQQSARLVADPWLPTMRGWLENRGALATFGVSIRQIMAECLGMKYVARRDTAHAMRVVSCLDSLGWGKRKRARAGDIREYRYYPE